MTGGWVRRVSRVFVLVALLSPVTAHATSYSWTNASGGNWSTPANWSPSGIPGTGDIATINTAGTYIVVVNTAVPSGVNLQETCAACTLDIQSGSLGLTGASSVSGGATFRISGGTTTLVNASDTLTVASGSSYVQTNGTITGPGAITVNGAATINGGTMSGAATTTFQSTLTLTLNTNHFFVDARTIDAMAAVTMTGPDALFLGNGATFNDHVSFDLQADINFNQTCCTGVGTFNVLVGATFTKSAASGNSTIGTIFNNDGTVNVNSGTLTVSGNSTSSGAWSVAAPATLAFACCGGAQSLTGSVSGAGAFLVNGGTVTIPSAYSVGTSTTVSSGSLTLSGSSISTGPLVSVSGGTLTISGTLSSFASTLNLTGGTLNLTPPVTVSSYTQSNGTFTSSASLTVTGAATVNGGTMSGAATTTFQSGLTLALNTNHFFVDARTIDAMGAVTMSGPDSLFLGNGATFNDHVSFDLQADINFNQTCCTGVGTFNVLPGATFTKSAATGNSTIGTIFNNDGTVNVNSGILFVTGNSTSTGPWTVAAGATLNFGCCGTQSLTGAVSGAGTFTTNGGAVTIPAAYSMGTATTVISGSLTLSGSSISTGSAVNVSGGALNITGTITSFASAVTIIGGTLNLGSAVTVASYAQSNGTFTGPGSLTVTGAATINGGTMSGAATTTFQSGLTLNLNTNHFFVDARTIDAMAAVTMSGPDSLFLGNGATFNDHVSFDLQADTNFNQSCCTGVGTFNVLAGATFTKSAASGNSAIGTIFNNAGTVNANSGTLTLSGNSTSAGAWNVAAPATLAFSCCGTQSLTGSVSGAGTFLANGGTVTIPSAYSMGTATNVTSGSLTLSGPSISTGPNLTMTGGTLNITGTLTSFATALTINAGTLALTPNATTTTFNESNGTLTGAGSLTVTGAASITGGTLSGTGGVTFQSGVTLNPSTNHIFFDAKPITALGPVTLSGPNILFISNGSVFTPQNTFDIQGNQQINTQCCGPSGTIAIPASGTLTKSAGTGTSFIATIVNNDGAVSVTAGTLQLAGGGTSTGTWTIGAGADLDFTCCGTQNINSGSVSGAGVLSVSGGTTNIAGTTNLSGSTTLTGGTLALNGPLTSIGSTLTISNGTLNLGSAATVASYSQANGGVLTGAGALTVTGAATITGGTLSGSGAIHFQSGATLNATTNHIFFDTRPVDATGVVTLSGPDILFISNSSVFTNHGTFNIQADTTINNQCCGPIGTIANASGATFEKTGGTGASLINVLMNNDGTVDVTSGTLRFAGGGTSTGAWTVGASGVLEFTCCGTQNMTAGSVTGPGLVNASGGTTTVAGTYNVGNTTVSGGTLNLNGTVTSIGTNLTISNGTLNLGSAATVATYTQSGGGVLTGAGAVTVTGAASITGGNLTGSGAVTFQSGLTLNPSTNHIFFDQRAVDTTGSVTLSGPDILFISNGSVFTNHGTFDIQGDQTIASQCCGPAGLISNVAGAVFLKSAGTGTSAVSVALNNAGTLNVNSGTLRLSGGGTSGGTFSAVSGATLQFDCCSTQTITGTFNGPGTLLTTGGTVNFNGSFNPNAALNITNGSFVLGTAGTVATFAESSGGVFGGAGGLTVTGAATITGGTLNGPGTTTFQGAVTLNPSSNHIFLDTRSVDLFGSTTLAGPDVLFISNGAILTNHGTFDMQGDQTISSQCCGPAGIFANLSGATFVKSAGTATAAVTTIVNNAGTLNVNSGTLRLSGGGTSGGTFSAVSGATLQFDCCSTQTITGTFNGPGTLLTSGGTVNFNGSFNPNAALNITNGSFVLSTAGTVATFAESSGGVLGGTGGLTVTGAATITGGTLNGPGTTTFQGAVTLNPSSNHIFLDTRSVDVFGSTTLAGPDVLFISNGAILTNHGTFDMQGDQTIGSQCCGPAGTFANPAGATFVKSAGTATATINTVLNNDGTLNVNSGTLRMSGGGVSTGNWGALSGATVQFDCCSTQSINAGTFNGPGTLLVSGGAVNFNGAFNATANLALSNGTFTLTSSPSVAGYTQSGGGTLNGAGALTVTGPASITGGTMSGAGTTSFQSGVALNLTTNHFFIDTRAVDISGSSSLTGPDLLYISNSAPFTNHGTFDIQGNQTIASQCCGLPGTVSNAAGATLTKSAGTGNTSITPVFSNAGSLNVAVGTLAFNGGFTQTAGATTVNGAISSPTTLAFNGGTLGGAGTIGGNVTSSAQVGPGNSPGMLTISGNYTQTAAGALNIELAGTTPGSQYDQLTVTGTATLDGTLNVTYLSGFTPPNGTTYQPITFASLSGDFATKNGLVFSGGSLSYSTNPTNITLAAGSCSAPPSAFTTTAPGGHICANGNFTASVTTLTTGATYSWSIPSANATFTTGASPDTINITAGASGVIQIALSVTSGGCTSASSVNVIVDPPVTATIAAPPFMCDNATANASVAAGPAGTSYAWTITNGTIQTGQNTNAITFTASSPTAPVGLSITVSNGACSANGSASVPVTPAPTPTITTSGPTTFCSGGSVTLTATSGGATYQWFNNNAPIGGATGVSFNATASGSYTVTMTNAAGCPGTSTPVVVTANPLPNATIAAPLSMCANSTPTANVPALAGATFTWTITNGTIQTGQGTNSITFSATQSPVTLGVTVMDSNGCSNTGSANVAVGSFTPTITASGPTSFCSGGTVTLTATTGQTYMWSTGATTQSITVNSSGSYSVTVTDPTGCTGTAAPVNVTVTTPPNTTITAPNTVLPGSTGNTASVPAGSAGTTYTWSITGGTITAGATTPSITFTAGNSGSVTLTVVVTDTGCSATGTFTIGAQAADIGVALSAPSSVVANAAFAYTATVNNAGPSSAQSIALQITVDPSVAINGNGGDFTCTRSGNVLNCSLATLVVGGTAIQTISVTAPGTTGSYTASAAVSAATNDPNSANQTASTSTTVTPQAPQCPASGPTLIAPANGAIGVQNPVTFTWTGVPNATTYELWIATGNNAPSMNTSTPATQVTVSLSAGPVSWFVIAKGDTSCAAMTSATQSFSVAAVVTCDHGAPELISPKPNETLPSPVTFEWKAVAGAIDYTAFVSIDGGAPQDAGTTDKTSLAVSLTGTNIVWYVVAHFAGCPSTQSASLAFILQRPDDCSNHTATTLIAPITGTSSSGVDFLWNSVRGASGYRVWFSANNKPFAALGTTQATTLHGTISSGSVEWFVETLFAGCASIESTHATFTIPAATSCNNVAATLGVPANGTTVHNQSIDFTWNPAPNAIGYEVYISLNSGSPALLGTTDSATSLHHDVAAGNLEWFVRALFNGCDAIDSQHATFIFDPPPVCPTQRPILLTPGESANGVTSPVSFAWSPVAGVSTYKLTYTLNDGDPVVLVSTDPHREGVAIGNGVVVWTVEAIVNSCPSLISTPGSFTVVPKPPQCTTPGATAIRGPSNTSSGVLYNVRWDAIPGAVSYDLQESTSLDFANAQTTSVQGTEQSFRHLADVVTYYYYRVRGVNSCDTVQRGLYSDPIDVGILPVQQTNPFNAQAATPVDNPQDTTYQMQICTAAAANCSFVGVAGSTFTVTTDQPWLSVAPNAGSLPAGGVTLTVTAATRGLGVGTNVGSVTVTFSGTTAQGKFGPNGTTPPATSNVSVNLVAPVANTPKNTPPPDALIIPAVAHADGLASHFESDIRVSNTSPQPMKYQLTFTPTGDSGIKDGKQTTIDIDPGRTVALDDVLQSWFGAGALAQGAAGSLEIRPLTSSASSVSSTAVSGLPNILTFASSRTYSTLAAGSLGTYVPAIPYANFIGRSSSALTLQQIAQNANSRTNFGLVEGSGEPATVLIKMFSSSGQPLGSMTQQLNGGQHLQINSILSRNNLNNITDGRIEVSVTSATGKVTAYASVLDNKTNDAQLVSPISLTQNGSAKYVLPGVADATTADGKVQTDLRLFNASSSSVTATLALHVDGSPANVVTKDVTLAAGQVTTLDNVLSSLFGVSNVGNAALHITTAAPTNLIATAKTYTSLASAGTIGQFINAVTPSQAITASSRPLQLLQVEESNRFSTDVGVAEVSGKPVDLEISIIPQDAKVAAKTTISLQAGEFHTMHQLLKSVGLDAGYNARVTIKVVGGAGAATAYASVTDQSTHDTTFLPAQ